MKKRISGRFKKYLLKKLLTPDEREAIRIIDGCYLTLRYLPKLKKFLEENYPRGPEIRSLAEALATLKHYKIEFKLIEYNPLKEAFNDPNPILERVRERRRSK